MADLATIQQQLAAQYPEFAAAPPDLQQKFIQVVLQSKGDPRKMAQGYADLQRQYPQYITNESIWKNKAFLAGLIGLTAGVGSALLAPAAAASTAPDLAAALPGAEGAAGVTAAGTIAPVAAATGGGSLLHALLPSIIGAGSNIAGTAIASHANTEAAKIAAEQADKALQIQQQQYALQRQDTAPYRALGQGAVNNLGFLSGIDTTSNLAALSSTLPTGPNAPPSTVVAPGAVDASGKPLPNAGVNVGTVAPPTPAQQRMSTLSQVGSSGTVRIQDPATGLVHLIPQADAVAAQQAGGRLV